MALPIPDLHLHAKFSTPGCCFGCFSKTGDNSRMIYDGSTDSFKRERDSFWMRCNCCICAGARDVENEKNEEARQQFAKKIKDVYNVTLTPTTLKALEIPTEPTKDLTIGMINQIVGWATSHRNAEAISSLALCAGVESVLKSKQATNLVDLKGSLNGIDFSFQAQVTQPEHNGESSASLRDSTGRRLSQAAKVVLETLAPQGEELPKVEDNGGPSKF